MTDQINALHPSEEKIEAIVAPGRSITAAANAEALPGDTKLFRPGEKVMLFPSEVKRLQGLGYLVVPPPAPPAGGEGEGEGEPLASSRARTRPSITAKDGPRVERGDAS